MVAIVGVSYSGSMSDAAAQRTTMGPSRTKSRVLPNAHDRLLSPLTHGERREQTAATDLDAVNENDQLVPIVQQPLHQLLGPLTRRFSRLTTHRGHADADLLRHLPDRHLVGPHAQTGR